MQNRAGQGNGSKGSSVWMYVLGLPKLSSQQGSNSTAAPASSCGNSWRVQGSGGWVGRSENSQYGLHRNIYAAKGEGS
jgi:hypothetical protein